MDDLDKDAVETLQSLRYLLRDYALHPDTPKDIERELLKAHEHLDEATHEAEQELWDEPLGTE